MKTQQMTEAEFLSVMQANVGLYPDFDALSIERKRLIAQVNICTGTAESFYDNEGRLIGVGGIRYMGLGEAWMLTLPEIREPFLLRTVAQNFERLRDEKHLWRVFAESKVSENFLKHLRFVRQDGMHIWTRG